MNINFPNPICVYKILGFQRYRSAIDELNEHEEIMKSRFLPTASDDRLDSLIIIAFHKYILKNIDILWWNNDRQKFRTVQKFPRIFFFTNNLAVMSE